MRKTKKILSVICALAMILSMFSTFVVANAADGIGITSEVSETTGKAGETVTVTFKANGVTTEKVRMVEFHVAIDTDKFEIVPYVNEDDESSPIKSALSGALSNLAGTDLGYSFTSPTGKKLNGTIGTLTLKLKADLTEKVTLKTSGALLTDGNGDMYDQASTDAAKKMYIDDIVVDPAGSTPSTTYTVTVDSANIKNGTVTVDKATAAENDKVTITAKADEGYEVDTITVKDADDKTVTVAADGTFTMPASNVTVTATFKKSETTGSKYPYAVNVSKGTTTTIGTKYTVTYTKNADYTETAPETFDVAVQVYNSSNEAAGYMIFKGVKATDTITFYIPKNSTAAVNTVDSFDDSNDNLGNLVAPREKK